MSARTGILHSEKNDSRRLGGESHTNPVHLIQMWVVPDESGVTPGYEQLEIHHELLSGGLITVASGMDKHGGDAAIRIRNRQAALYASRLVPGQPIQLPEAPYLHLFVTRGSIELEGTGTLAEGDAARFTYSGGQRISVASPDSPTRSSSGRCTPTSPGEPPACQGGYPTFNGEQLGAFCTGCARTRTHASTSSPPRRRPCGQPATASSWHRQLPSQTAPESAPPSDMLSSARANQDPNVG
jgi:hypothetical protein